MRREENCRSEECSRRKFDFGRARSRGVFCTAWNSALFKQWSND